MSLQSKIESFISSQAANYTDLSEIYLQFGSLYDKKLWYQLTNLLLDFVKNESNFRGDNMIQLYTNFIKFFEDKLNQLHFAIICTHISKQYYPSKPYMATEITNAINFLQDISGAGVKIDVPTKKEEDQMEVEGKDGEKESKGESVDEASAKTNEFEEQKKLLKQKRTKLTESGYLVMLCGVTGLKLKEGDVEAVKFLIDESEEILDALDGVDPIVHASVYLVKADYHDVVGPASLFYESALQYLAYTPMSDIKKDRAIQLATSLSLSALVGEGIYNFGEVLATPLIDVLTDTPLQWLGDLLRACNSGDIAGFNNIASSHATAFASQPALSTHSAVIKQKIALLALVDLIFHRPANNRSISFKDISEATSLPLDQVEWLVMKAMSIGLIRGIIYEIEEVVHVSWVQPRVLNDSQMTSLQTKLDAWEDVTKNMLTFVEQNTKDILN